MAMKACDGVPTVKYGRVWPEMWTQCLGKEIRQWDPNGWLLDGSHSICEAHFALSAKFLGLDQAVEFACSNKLDYVYFEVDSKTMIDSLNTSSTLNDWKCLHISENILFKKNCLRNIIFSWVPIEALLENVLLVFFILVCVAESDSKVKFFNVKDYGATADGKTDNSQAFLKAWKEACEWEGKARFWIPEGTFQLNPVIFDGPCKGFMAFVIKGVLIAPAGPFTDKWINFRYVNNLAVFGGGKLVGQGATAWHHNDCSNNPNCRQLASNIRFDFITNGRVHHIHSIDSKSSHIVIFGCKNMNFTKIRISAPEDSPNTDGIKIGKSFGINITRTAISTGDDCIAMISGTRTVRISEVMCGPGHGISVGSLGRGDGEEDVEDIVVKNCTFDGTSQGVRIKTWANPLSKPLKAYNFLYEDIVMNNVRNPIIIDQQYCPFPRCYTQVSSQVEISKVRYKNIQGSSSSEEAITLNCSKDKPCQDITLEDINLWPHPSSNLNKLTSSCSNVNGASYGKQNPPGCF
ncbi:exopolygalacturonase-like [Prosopis cineraria]|uniref:exopolygalacturonase-like n=1 Tax=Prosopis cineraria TaxID=364024 RepID=UPI0024107324|nr:exopolygalacturonase-like [Prosopis cineraria]